MVSNFRCITKIIILLFVCLSISYGQTDNISISTGYSFQRYQFVNGHGFNLAADYTRRFSDKWSYSVNLIFSNTYASSVRSGLDDNVMYNTNLNYFDYPDGVNWFPIRDNAFTQYQNYNFVHFEPQINYGHDYILNGSFQYLLIDKKIFQLTSGIGTGIGLAVNQELLSFYTWTALPITVEDPNTFVKYEFVRQVKYIYWECNLNISGKYMLGDKLSLILEGSYNFKPEMIFGDYVGFGAAGVSRLNFGLEIAL